MNRKLWKSILQMPDCWRWPIINALLTKSSADCLGDRIIGWRTSDGQACSGLFVKWCTVYSKPYRLHPDGPDSYPDRDSKEHHIVAGRSNSISLKKVDWLAAICFCRYAQHWSRSDSFNTIISYKKLICCEVNLNWLVPEFLKITWF